MATAALETYLSDYQLDFSSHRNLDPKLVLPDIWLQEWGFFARDSFPEHGLPKRWITDQPGGIVNMQRTPEKDWGRIAAAVEQIVVTDMDAQERAVAVGNFCFNFAPKPVRLSQAQRHCRIFGVEVVSENRFNDLIHDVRVAVRFGMPRLLPDRRRRESEQRIPEMPRN